MKILFQLFFILSIFSSLGAGRTPDLFQGLESTGLEIARVVISEMDGVDTSRSMCTAYIADAATHCIKGKLDGFHRNVSSFYKKCFTKKLKPSVMQIKQAIQRATRMEATKHNLKSPC